MASIAGSHGVVVRWYDIFARTSGSEIDPCRPRMGSEKGKAERSVRIFRGAFWEVFCWGAGSMEELQHRLDGEADAVSPLKFVPPGRESQAASVSGSASG